MRYVYVIVLISLNVFSQNATERNFIRSKSVDSEVFNLQDKIKQNYFTNQLKVKEFLLLNPNLKNKENLQRIIDGVPYFYKEDNNALSVETLRANSMYLGGSLGLNVAGSGMFVGVWDGGRVRETHVEFLNRIELCDAASSLSTHSTHVTGTIIAAGVSPTRRGFAYEATAKAYDWSNDINEIFGFANNGYLVSNHSYGNIASTLPVNTFGAYNSQSIEADQLMNTFPYYQMVKSAGNDRNDTAISQVLDKGGFDLLTGVATAKNVLTVAAVSGMMLSGEDLTTTMSSFSNFGPTDDGRIKPDISAKGVEVSSTISNSNSAYGLLQGTSMAAPAITGLIVLLQKHYNNVTPNYFMKSATVRGLLCQSAREAGDYIGPDYSFGWGIADGLKAANTISNKGVSSILEEKTLVNNQVFTKNIVLNTTQDLNVAISWTDPVGFANSSTQLDNRSPRLINNLDLKVFLNGVIYYPWKLNPDSLFDGATNNSDNDADNIERVEIFGAVPGVYTIQVTHKGTLLGQSQDYSLIASGTNGISLNSRDYDMDNSIFVYPNPVSDVLNYKFKDNVEISNIEITDLAGKQIYFTTEPKLHSNINVSNFESGVYFVKFSTDSNTSIVKKFIKN